MALLPYEIILAIFDFTRPFAGLFINKPLNTLSRAPSCTRQHYVGRILQSAIAQRLYRRFLNCIRNAPLSYLAIEPLLYRTIHTLPTVWTHAYQCGFYDLRYIFEIIYYIFQTDIDIDEDRVKQSNPHFFNHFYTTLQKQLTPNRTETIYNINQIGRLRSLHHGFVGYDKTTRRQVERLIDYNMV
jgi:hypothetical protein